MESKILQACTLHGIFESGSPGRPCFVVAAHKNWIIRRRRSISYMTFSAFANSAAIGTVPVSPFFAWADSTVSGELSKSTFAQRSEFNSDRPNPVNIAAKTTTLKSSARQGAAASVSRWRRRNRSCRPKCATAKLKLRPKRQMPAWRPKQSTTLLGRLLPSQQTLSGGSKSQKPKRKSARTPDV